MIDWHKEWDLWKRIFRWWMITGLISIPFGALYGFVTWYGHDSKLALFACIVPALIAVYLIQGMPPDK